MRAAPARIAIAALWVAAIVGLAWLGTWQVHRRAWKLDLIARVDARIHAAPVSAPMTAGSDDTYRRIVATGTWMTGKDSFIQAVTDRGPGWWVMTPLRTASGTVLVNRGYVPRRVVTAPPIGAVRVTGLLRISEPGGGFLHRNDPAGDHWYSRDVAAIAARRGLGPTANYFIDADDTHAAPGDPVGGLTVIAFPNNHLVYAVTWYTLAVMAAAALFYWFRLDHSGDR